MYFSLPQLFVFLFDVLSVAVFVMRDRFVKNNNRLVLKSLSLCNKVFSSLLSVSFKEFEQQTYTEYKQERSDSIATHERYLMYSTFKSSLTMSPFLHDLKHIKARNYLLTIK